MRAELQVPNVEIKTIDNIVFIYRFIDDTWVGILGFDSKTGEYVSIVTYAKAYGKTIQRIADTFKNKRLKDLWVKYHLPNVQFGKLNHLDKPSAELIKLCDKFEEAPGVVTWRSFRARS